MMNPEVLAASESVKAACDIAYQMNSDTIYIKPRSLTEEFERIGFGGTMNPQIWPEGPRMIYGYKIKFVHVPADGSGV